MSQPSLEPLNRLAGSWITEATHPAVPGVIVRGVASFEWLEGQRFLILRMRNDHPDFPDAISIIGFTDVDRVATHVDQATARKESRLSMHYFDSRGVFRLFEMSVDGDEWRLWRDAPGFSQRFAGRFTDHDNAIVGQWQLCQDEAHWNDDLTITFRRQ